MENASYYCFTPLAGEHALVLLNEAGITALHLGDDEVSLRETHASLFESLKPRPCTDNPVLYDVLKHALHCYENYEQVDAALLQLEGTEFQCEVWRALMQIPAGETRSYGELAEAMGKPKAFRALANACGKNEIALLVPCHRVVGKGGHVNGYRWGPERKARLLAREGVTVKLD